MNSLSKIFTKFNNKKLFILSNKKFITYKEIYNNALNFASYLQKKHKIQPGKIIFLNINRSTEYFTGILSLIFLGATIIPISNRISKFEINYLRKKYDPYLELTSVKTKINYGKITLKSKHLNKAQIIFFTSGTTGKPKGILHKISNLLISANNFSILANYKSCKVILHNWPHYYMAGFFNMFLCPILSGVSIFFDKEISNDTYLKYWNRIAQSKIDIAYLSPTMAQALIAYSQYEKISKKNKRTIKIISTGSFLYNSTKKKFKKIFGIDLINCYGVTEIGGSISLEQKSFKDNKSVGKMCSGISVKITKNKEIFIKSNSMFQGYMEDKKSFKKFSGKYFNTGDLGEYRNGRLFVYGRTKEIIKKGGEQVSLIKIEDIALGYKDVKEVIARGVASEFWGEEVELNVVFAKDKKQTDTTVHKIENLKKYLLQKLTKFEMPSKITAVRSISKTPIGKRYRQIFKK